MKSRTLRATAFGLLTGLLIGVLGWGVLAAFVGNGHMSDLSEKPAYLTLAAVAALGAANGGIGGWTGCRTGRRGVVPVLWVALLPLLFPVAVYAEIPDVSKWWFGALIVAAFVIPFVWVAGRVGQELGVSQRPAERGEEEPAPPSLRLDLATTRAACFVLLCVAVGVLALFAR